MLFLLIFIRRKKLEHILKCHNIVKTDFVRAENCYLYDSKGKRYVDFESGIWAASVGHNHPRIKQVIKAQIDKVIHLGTNYPSEIAEQTALDVLDIVGIKNGKCTFLSSGSEAVELGVRIARTFTEKKLLLTFPKSYLAAFGSAGKKDPDEWHIFDWSLCAENKLEECLDDIPFEDIGAFVFEPGGSGIALLNFPSKKVVELIAQKVKENGGLIVANEITTGMGRTGKWFGFQHYDIQPDVVAIGKGLGDGYPVSAVAMNKDIAINLEEMDFHYVQSHQNDPLGCAIASEVISIMRDENLLERANEIGGFFFSELKKLQDKFEIVKDVRARGMLLGIEFSLPENKSVYSIYESLVEAGFLVGDYSKGNLLRFDPSLTIEKENIISLVECLEELLSKI